MFFISATSVASYGTIRKKISTFHEVLATASHREYTKKHDSQREKTGTTTPSVLDTVDGSKG
jgi:hypothetical protein